MWTASAPVRAAGAGAGCRPRPAAAPRPSGRRARAARRPGRRGWLSWPAPIEHGGAGIDHVRSTPDGNLTDAVNSSEGPRHTYNPPIDVLLLCTANQCRSPMAEVLLRHHLAAAGRRRPPCRRPGCTTGGVPPRDHGVGGDGRRGPRPRRRTAAGTSTRTMLDGADLSSGWRASTCGRSRCCCARRPRPRRSRSRSSSGGAGRRPAADRRALRPLARRGSPAAVAATTSSASATTTSSTWRTRSARAEPTTRSPPTCSTTCSDGSSSWRSAESPPAEGAA